MINSSKKLESFLQQYRFRKIIPYLKGEVLDFGGNEGELKKYVPGGYTLVNYDHTPMQNKTFDTIVALAVIEHIPVKDVFDIFHSFKTRLRPDGTLLLTTPTPRAKPLCELLAFLHLLDPQNIREHKHYWTKEDICQLAEQNGFVMKSYKKFQWGFNQMAVLEPIVNRQWCPTI
jgi:2-polyprenyl-3-methyl-5-hydroxy-6-metoxy-1,4-benzoquinol methylase